MSNDVSLDINQESNPVQTVAPPKKDNNMLSATESAHCWSGPCTASAPCPCSPSGATPPYRRRRAAGSPARAA